MQILSDNFETMLIELVGRQVDKSIKEIEKKYAIRNRYLNKKNACQYAGISAPTLDSWIEQGLSVSKINGSYCIDLIELDKFIEQHRL